MTIDITNPWDEMKESTRRRVDALTNHDVFWLVDIGGRYGFYIETDNDFVSETVTVSLNGIDVIKRNSKQNKGELILILHEKEEWQIFCKLCEDLISSIHLHEDNDSMISAVEVRLQRWQELLKRGYRKGMSIELQMGLFSELLSLKETFIPNIGLSPAIHAWVGPDADKQDFLIDHAVIEVKSHRTSKGEIASISSVEQLYSEKEPLYLFSYGLTRSENGQSVEKLANEIEGFLESETDATRELFKTKLIDYGFVPELESESLVAFLADTKKMFYVSDGFPCLTPLSVPNRITAVKYVLDLALCKEYEVPINTIFKED